MNKSDLKTLIKEIYNADKANKNLVNRLTYEANKFKKFEDYNVEQFVSTIVDIFISHNTEQDAMNVKFGSDIDETVAIDSDTAEKNPDLLKILDTKKIPAKISDKKTIDALKESDEDSDTDFEDTYEKENEKAKKELNKEFDAKDKEPKISDLKVAKGLEKNKENLAKVAKAIKIIGEKFKVAKTQEEKDKLKEESKKLVKLRNQLEDKLDNIKI